MNTKQTIVLWYAGLASVVVVFYLMEQQGLHVGIGLLSVIGVISGLLIYSLGEHSQATGSDLLKYVVGPIGGAAALLGILLLGAYLYHASPLASAVSTDKVAVVDPSLKVEEREYGPDQINLSGRIRNNSSREITFMEIRARIHSVRFENPRYKDDATPREIVFGYWGALLDSIPVADQKRAELVDGQTVTWRSYTGVPTGETESFEIRESTSMQFPDSWVWSFELLSVR